MRLSVDKTVIFNCSPSGGLFYCLRFGMSILLERQIESDSYGYYCIDTYQGLVGYPFCGYGYTEQEAIKDAEEQARKHFNKRQEAL